MKLADWLIGIILAAAGVAIIVASQGLPQLHGQMYGAGFFPTIIGGGFVLVGLALGVTDFARAGGPAVAFGDWVRRPRAWGRIGASVGGTVAYILLLQPLGFMAASLLLLLLLLPAFGVRLVVAVPVAVLATAGTWYLFGELLRVALPFGYLEQLIRI